MSSIPAFPKKIDLTFHPPSISPLRAPVNVRFPPIADISVHGQVQDMRASSFSFLTMWIWLTIVPTVAQACSVIVTREPYPAERRREARKQLDEATAVIDGEVVRALAGEQPALVRAARVLKGPRQEYFAVGERHSCDIPLTEVGQRLRLILVGGPDIYYLPVDYSNARYEDRILRSDRRRAWPWRQRRQLAQ